MSPHLSSVFFVVEGVLWCNIVCLKVSFKFFFEIFYFYFESGWRWVCCYG
jgi:hypothetical protein